MDAGATEPIAEPAVEAVASPSANEAPGESPAPPPKPMVEVRRGEMVPLADLLAGFDPECEFKCTRGLKKAGRPAPRGLKGIVWVHGPCGCTVRRWIEQHPELPKEPAPIRVGRAALLAAKGLSATPSERGSRRLGLLRAELAREQEALRAIGERLESGLSSLTKEAVAIDEEERDNHRRLVEAESTKKLAAQRLEALRAELSGLQAEVREAENEIERTTWAAGSFGLRRQEVERKISSARERLAPQESATRKRIEKLERRIATVVAYHPEVPSDG